MLDLCFFFLRKKRVQSLFLFKWLIIVQVFEVLDVCGSCSECFKTLLLMLKNWLRRLFFSTSVFYGKLLSIWKCRSFVPVTLWQYAELEFWFILLFLYHFLCDNMLNLNSVLFYCSCITFFKKLIWCWSWLVRCNTEKKIRFFLLIFPLLLVPLVLFNVSEFGYGFWEMLQR